MLNVLKTVLLALGVLLMFSGEVSAQQASFLDDPLEWIESQLEPSPKADPGGFWGEGSEMWSPFERDFLADLLSPKKKNAELGKHSATPSKGPNGSASSAKQKKNRKPKKNNNGADEYTDFLIDRLFNPENEPALPDRFPEPDDIDNPSKLLSLNGLIGMIR